MKLKKSEFYSYDSRRKVLLCRGRAALMQTLKLIMPSVINLKKTLRNVRMAGYVDTKGQAHVYKNYPMLFNHLEKECGLPIHANKCFLTGMAMVSPLFTLSLKQVPENLIEDEPKEVQLDNKEADSSVDTAKEGVDIAFAKLLEDKDNIAQSKKALAEYAAKFGIELKQNKKFENMISDLEKAM